jgi:phospholipase/carboxylesterase
MTSDPHGTQAIVSMGTPLADAAGVLILLHGRGGTAEDILGLGEAIAPEKWAMLAPQASGNSWYPLSFLAPREQNEPYLTSALGRVQAAVDTALAAGVAAEKIVIGGFSQGACLATEFVGRNPRRYAALLAFTGGLIGPLGAPIQLTGDLAGTPVLLSSGDPDPHVPWARVQQSAELLQGIGGRVTIRRYPGKLHSVAGEELRSAIEVLAVA